MTFVDVDEVRHLSTHRHQRLLYLPNLGDIQDLYPQSTMSMKKIASTMMQMMANTGAKGAKHDPIPMIYPYSTTAEMIHHPWVYNFKVSWMLRYMCYSALLMYPLLWKITSIGMYTVLFDSILGNLIMCTSCH